MFFFTFLATPTPEAKEYSDTGGAYVHCWVQGEQRGEAEQRASGLIHDYGWSVEALEEGATVTSADYAEEDEDREFYEEALMEGAVLVFNTWPRDEEDQDGEEDWDWDESEEEEEEEEDDSAGADRRG
jgi:hypothetical protein